MSQWSFDAMWPHRVYIREGVLYQEVEDWLEERIGAQDLYDSRTWTLSFQVAFKDPHLAMECKLRWS